MTNWIYLRRLQQQPRRTKTNPLPRRCILYRLFFFHLLTLPLFNLIIILLTMIRAIRLAVNTCKNNTSLQAYVGNRVYPAHIATLADPKYPAVTITMDSGDSPGDYVMVQKQAVTITVWSADSYDECHDIMTLIKGDDHTTEGILNHVIITDENSDYKCTFHYRSNERQASYTRDEQQDVIYSLSTEWMVDARDA